MAHWIINRNVNNLKIRVFYLNLSTGIRHPLGELPVEIEDYRIVRWIVDHGEPSPMDKIELSDGNELLFDGKNVRLDQIKLDNGHVLSYDNTVSN